jgi:hypothetical protein
MAADGTQRAAAAIVAGSRLFTPADIGHRVLDAGRGEPGHRHQRGEPAED